MEIECGFGTDVPRRKGGDMFPRSWKGDALSAGMR
jgi:hypothetical protein